MGSYATSITRAADQRVQLETTGGGQFVSPDAVVANAGLSTKVGDFSSMSQTIGDLSLGLSGEQVKSILDSTYAANLAQSSQASQLASSAVQSLAASKGAESIDVISRYIPYILAAVVLIAILRRGHAR
jgi:hypothetical protein